MGDKAVRSWLASLIFLSLVVGLIAFLTFLTIPENRHAGGFYQYGHQHICRP
jgi:hypothetical protein